MAYDLATARRAAQERGDRPPGGELPGTPAYDQWVMAWFEAGLNAGDPDLIRRAGGTAAEEGEGGIADWANAAPSVEWLGKRKPTPRELRRHARDAGQSEDYQRFDDRQLAAWINSHWDVNQGAFFNDYGDRVEKPTESGARSMAAGAPTGMTGAGGRGGGGGGVPGGGGGGGRPPVQPPQPAPGAGAYQSLEDPLQAQLYQLIQSRGVPGQQWATNASSLAGGGVLSWGNAPMPTEARAMKTAPGMAPPTKGPSAGLPGSPFVTNALGGAPTNPWSSWAQPGGQPKPPAWGAVPAPNPTPGSFDANLLNKFSAKNPATQWWMK